MSEQENNSHPEADQLLKVARTAASAFSTFNKDQVEKIVNAVTAVAEEKSEFYAEWAVRETGFGDVDDKTQKNLLCSAGARATYDVADYVEPKVDREKKIVSFPKPAGVVVALVPCTNPVATVYFKSIISLMTRNSVILCPHPAAKECCVHAADLMAEVAEKAGAPKGAIQVVREPSIPLVNYLLHSDQTNLILATGGPAMVRAAYSSGNPALGVGPANVACYVHESADIATAGAQAVTSNSFDNSLPCTCESVVIADKSISAQLKESMIAGGGYFVEGDEQRLLRDFLYPETGMNMAALGKSPSWMADSAGFSVPEGTKSLVVEINEIGLSEPISKEKMFPVLGFFNVDGPDQAIDAAQGMLDIMGKGHSAVIHANDPAVVARYGAALPVCRVTVNNLGILGSAGLNTNLAAGPVIGTGFFGRSSVDENVGPKQLIQMTSVAYTKEPEVEMGDVDKALAEL